jgi:hypothetical protein
MRSLGKCCGHPKDPVPKGQQLLHLKFTRGNRIAFHTVQLSQNIDLDKYVAVLQAGAETNPTVLEMISKLHWFMPSPVKSPILQGW